RNPRCGARLRRFGATQCGRTGAHRGRRLGGCRMTLGAKGRDTSAAAALADAEGVGAGAAFGALAFFFAAPLAAFFGALRAPAFFLPARFAVFLRAELFLRALFLPADFFRLDFFPRADFLRAADFRAAERLRVLFLRAAMVALPRDADHTAPCG